MAITSQATRIKRNHTLGIVGAEEATSARFRTAKASLHPVVVFGVCGCRQPQTPKTPGIVGAEEATSTRSTATNTEDPTHCGGGRSYFNQIPHREGISACSRGLRRGCRYERRGHANSNGD
ncbi:hypothetical protein R1flu_006236 [Riccia fluitans]|uniref:Uncharacterized protein n=1 Tax=Riccia fluitans TaxID=41844 RepID=A0ABD1YVG0_9MARC